MSKVPGTSQSGKSTRYFFTWYLFIGLLLLVGGPAALACPTCKETLFDAGTLPQRRAAAKGYALSIGLLLGMPLALVGGGSALIVRAQRRKQRAGGPEGGIDTPGLSR